MIASHGREAAEPGLWGEIQLCWDKDARNWSLHIPYKTRRQLSEGVNITAIDEGIINPMALGTWTDEHVISVTIINGRQGRATKHRRNKAVGSLQHKISKCRPGSKGHRKLVSAKKKIKSKTRRQLRDFCHKVSRRGADHAVSNNIGRLICGDVRGVERKTKVHHRVNRHMRQQLSRWSRGTQETYLQGKTGLVAEYLSEDGSTKTCPKCLTRNRPKGRYYRCKNPECGSACHRDALGGVNILRRAVYGAYTPIGTDTQIHVTYLRAVERWSLDQRQAHHKVQSRQRQSSE